MALTKGDAPPASGAAPDADAEVAQGGGGPPASANAAMAAADASRGAGPASDEPARSSTTPEAAGSEPVTAPADSAGSAPPSASSAPPAWAGASDAAGAGTGAGGAVQGAAAGSGATAGTTVLMLIRPLAVLALFATILGRALAPAIPGIAVGTGRLVRPFQIAGDLASQLFGMAATVVALALALSAPRARLSAVGRFAGAGLMALVILGGLGASVQPRISDVAAALVGGSASVLAVLAAREGRRSPYARVVATAAGAMGAAALVRLAAVALAYAALGGGSTRLAVAARVVSTVAFIADAAGVTLAIVWLAARGARPGADGVRRLVGPVTLVAIAAALLLTRAALSGGGDAGGTYEVLAWRAADRLLARPDPYVALPVRVFFALGILPLAIAALLTRRQIPALTGGLALLFLGRSHSEAPLGGLAMAIGALAVAIAASDDRGFWRAALGTPSRARSPADRTAPARAAPRPARPAPSRPPRP